MLAVFIMKKIQKNVYVQVTSSGHNVGCVVGEDGVVSIDLPFAPQEALAWRTQIAELTDKPLRAVIFTASDRVNSDVLGAVNLPSIIHESALTQIPTPVETGAPYTYPTDVMSAVMVRDYGPQPEVTYSDKMTYSMGVRHQLHIDVQYIGGYGPGSAFVSVRDTGVLFTGDHVTTGQPPQLAYGDFTRWSDALSALKKNKKVTILVPGHGPVGDLTAINEVLDYIKLATSRVKALVRGNKSRADVQAIIPDILALYALKAGKTNRQTVDIDAISRVIRAGLERIYDDFKQEPVGG